MKIETKYQPYDLLYRVHKNGDISGFFVNNIRILHGGIVRYDNGSNNIFTCLCDEKNLFKTLDEARAYAETISGFVLPM